MGPRIVIGGYFRSGTTWLLHVLNRCDGLRFTIEPDVNRTLPWHRRFVESYLSEEFDPNSFGDMLSWLRWKQVFKFTRGAIRWAAYLDAMAQWFPLRIVYIIRHPRGIVASHEYRGYPVGFDRREVSPNLLAAVEKGWPYNEDHDFFRVLTEAARDEPHSWMVTVAEWMAHCYDGVRHTELRAGMIVPYEALCRRQEPWEAMYRHFGREWSQSHWDYVRNCGDDSATTGTAGIANALGRQRRLGHLADEPFERVRGWAAELGDGLPQRIIDTVEANRI